MSLSGAGGTGGVITPSFLKLILILGMAWNGIPPLVINGLARFIGVF